MGKMPMLWDGAGFLVESGFGWGVRERSKIKVENAKLRWRG